jgi:hypothetical protein
MKTYITLSIAFLALTFTTLHASDSDKKSMQPYTIGDSYIIYFSPISPTLTFELPTGIAKVIEDTEGGWVKIEYSIFRTSQEDNQSGKITAEEIRHSAWINLAHVVAFITPEK